MNTIKPQDPGLSSGSDLEGWSPLTDESKRKRTLADDVW